MLHSAILAFHTRQTASAGLGSAGAALPALPASSAIGQGHGEGWASPLAARAWLVFPRSRLVVLCYCAGGPERRAAFSWAVRSFWLCRFCAGQRQARVMLITPGLDTDFSCGRRPCRRRASYQSAWTAVPLCSVATVPLAPHAMTADRSGQLSIPSCQCLAMPAGDS
jgi:hypothetical protein